MYSLQHSDIIIMPDVNERDRLLIAFNDKTTPKSSQAASQHAFGSYMSDKE